MDAPRLLRMTSPLGPGALVATRLSVTEEVGLPYVIEAEVVGNPGLVASDLLTKEVSFKIVHKVDDQTIERNFHGVVTSFSRQGPGLARRDAYVLRVSPGLWRLGLKRNCRIFQDKTVRDIVNQLAQEHDQPAPKWGITPDLQPIPYCTQFNETDLHFLSRLLEEFGLTYYFTHTASSHRMLISATAQGFPAFEGGSVNARHESMGFYELNDWARQNDARSASTKLEDMDKERSQPSVVLKKNTDTRPYEGEPRMWSAGEVFFWPGGMSTRPGVDSAAVTMGGLETLSETYRAAARDPRLTCGIRLPVNVKLEGGSEEKQQYVVTAVRHEAIDRSGLVSGAGGSESYAGSLSLVSASRTWMPEPRHTRPVLAGLYSAKVTGPSGEKIHVDEFGRVKVRFRWDRLGKDDDTSSCWLRVTQLAAGSWGGTWFLPRVGDEVIVAFLDGDPDRPVVAGSLYGKDAKPPFDPGANRAQSGIKTRSYKSDSNEDANILRFEDKKGAEEVMLHAQKDLAVEVEHDETRTIQNQRVTKIKDADDTLTLDRGDLTITCKLGAVMIEAQTSITLKVGQNTIVIDQMGITAKGLTITEEAQLVHQTKSPMIKEDADAMVQVHGAVIMLN